MSEDSEDIIKKLTEDVPDGKATFPADEDDEFNLLLDNFIQSELKNIEEEKNNTRIMLEEPEPQPIKQNASDDEVADALELAEQKLYTAYRNYVVFPRRRRQNQTQRHRRRAAGFCRTAYRREPANGRRVLRGNPV